jgi:hypothetical protein
MSIGLVEWHCHVASIVVIVRMLGWQGGLLDDVVVSVELVTWCCHSSVGTVVWHHLLSVALVRWLAVCRSRVCWAGMALPRCRIHRRRSYIGLEAWCVVVVWVCNGWGQEVDMALLMLRLSGKWCQTWTHGPCIAMGYINTRETILSFTHLSHFFISSYVP